MGRSEIWFVIGECKNADVHVTVILIDRAKALKTCQRNDFPEEANKSVFITNSSRPLAT